MPACLVTPTAQAYNDNIGNVTQRGNCSYARSVKRRIDYISLCSSFNNPDGWSGLMEVGQGWVGGWV
jgi:hypothetical protein